MLIESDVEPLVFQNRIRYYIYRKQIHVYNVSSVCITQSMDLWQSIWLYNTHIPRYMYIMYMHINVTTNRYALLSSDITIIGWRVMDFFIFDSLFICLLLCTNRSNLFGNANEILSIRRVSMDSHSIHFDKEMQLGICFSMVYLMWIF